MRAHPGTPTPCTGAGVGMLNSLHQQLSDYNRPLFIQGLSMLVRGKGASPEKSVGILSTSVVFLQHGFPAARLSQGA
jgi:hypothetical protein